jgi:tetratricopeptide (TPR) repeat protein
MDMGRLDESEAAFLEALEINRDAANETELHLHRVASVLNNLGTSLIRAGNLAKADKALREAIEIWEEKTMVSPEVFGRHLTKALCNLYILLSRTERDEAAVKETMEKLSRLGITEIPGSEESEDEDLWFHEIFYHWSDCPFCI